MSSKSDKKKSLVPRLRFPEFREAGAWEVKKLGAVLTFQTGFPFSSKYFNEIGDGLRLIRNADLKSSDRMIFYSGPYEQTFIVNNGDILVGMDGDFSPSIWGHGKALLNQRVGRVSAKDGSSLTFLHFSVSVALKLIEQRTAQTTVKHLSHTTVEKTKWPIPIFHEQQKIAHCLSSLDEVIGLQAKKVQALKQHKKGLMQQLFPAEGETTPRLRFPDFREAGAWEVKRLGGICNVLQGYGFPERLQGRQGGKYPFCKVSDITSAVNENGGHVVTAANYADEDIVAELRAKPIPVGATIFAKIGEALRLNKRAIVDVECLVDNNVAGLKAKTSAAVDYFIFLLSQNVDLNKHCGGAVPSVNKSTIEAIKVLAPEPPEQQKIAHCLSSLDEVIGLESHKLDALKNLKKGLMQQLFPQ
uniref:restriction endonuclease subunit S n=5 Tax=Thiolapillus sp. TaxID=2017437 RepID=UPI003AF4F51A